MAWGAGAVLNTSFELGAAFGTLLVEQHPGAPAALLNCLVPGGSPLQNSNAAGALMNLAASSGAITADVLQGGGVERLVALLANAKAAEQEGDSVAACHAAGALANLLRDPDAVETLLSLESPAGPRTIVEALEGETEEASRDAAKPATRQPATRQPATRCIQPATRRVQPAAPRIQPATRRAQSLQPPSASRRAARRALR